MNILIIDNSIAFTGALKCALNEAETFKDKHRFVFILHYQSTQIKLLKEKGFKVYTLPMVEIKKSLPVLLLYPLMLLRNTWLLHNILKEEHIDILQVNDFYNLLGAMVKKTGYKGKLITYVRFLPSVIPGALRKVWIKQAVKYSHKVIAVSDAVLKQLPERKNVVRIYDPVQLTENLPAKQHKGKDIISLLYLSNYILGKGQDYALEAFIKAYKKNQGLRLTYMGGDMGLEKNKAFKADLQKKVRRLKMDEIISFATFNSNVEEAIKEADIVLNFSQAESFSMTCLEAAFYGTPLIATCCGGPEEIINNRKTGLIVPLTDTDAMASAILELAESEGLRKEYAEAGKDYVRKKFSIAHYKEHFDQVISD